MIGSDDLLIRCLVEEGVAGEEAARASAVRAREAGRSLEETLVEDGVVSTKQIALARSVLSECPFVDLEHFDIDIQNASMMPRGVAEKHQVFPLFVMDGVITVGMLDPMNLRAIDQLRQILKVELDTVLCEREALGSLIRKAYSLVTSRDSEEESRARSTHDELTTGDEPIVAAVNQILMDAVTQSASDVHISPTERELQVRYRIDGELQDRQGPSMSAHAGVVQRLKVMAGLDLTQTRRPQDGKFRFERGSSQVDVRLSTLPTVCGENVVMRLLRPHSEILDFAELGMSEDLSKRIEVLIDRPYGMLLVTGPTGSGKTSTLYTAIKRLNTPDRNIITIEDPVEIRMHGVRQVQANAEIGMTFANALRSILRQDPDVVLVGEIRDQETAMIALQAALTGHMVLSTLHTNDASGAIARLKDLGVPSFVVNSAVLGVIAQRLVRRVCADCARPAKQDARMLGRFGVRADDGQWVEGKGCARCGGSGFRGRVGVYEMLTLDSSVCAAIERGASTQELARVGEANGMRPMWMDGLEKARRGLTTLDEVSKAVASVDLDGDESLRLSA
ncbi:MAG: type II/IV secretion system protein [Phycisphaeraceae bacterium]|nr:type II/IV secretion system protein [Phycisphaerales bacterium]MCB9844132.1 type II/IV secretion system protein [Phycisphaeraceae bacterium]